MSLTFKQFLLESDDEDTTIKGVANSYLIDPDDDYVKRSKKHAKQYKRVIDSQKWREYLQLATRGTN